MKLPHWHYFISLEDEIVKISRFIEISEDNYDVYSIELTKLFLSICSEVDVIIHTTNLLGCIPQVRTRTSQITITKINTYSS